MTTKQLKSAAAASLAAAPSHKSVTRAYTAVYLALGLALALVTALCEYLISRTGGLGDLQKRTFIATAEMVITLAIQVFTPLWTMGFTACAIGFARRQPVTNGDLLQGAKRWPVFLRYALCLGALYLGAAYLFIVLIVYLYLYSPMGQPLLGQMDALLSAGEMTEEAMAQMEQLIAPMYIIWVPVVLVGVTVMRYFFFIAPYRLLDQDRPGAIRSMRESFRLLRGHRLELLKLDLHYLWFYLLSAAASGILWLPELLTMAGLDLPVSSTLMYLLCYLLFMPALWLLYTTALPKLETAYALFYTNLLDADPISKG